MSAVTNLWKINRLLLAIYMIALLGLLMFPIAGHGYRIFGIAADKWMHLALFGGLAILLRWNLSSQKHAVLLTVCAAFVVAVATEVAQVFVSYRGAELWDVIADILGAVLGAITMNQLMSFQVPEKAIGLVVAAIGLMLSTLFVLADLVGVGDNDIFGTAQMAGTALGILITAGGVAVYKKKWARSV